MAPASPSAGTGPHSSAKEIAASKIDDVTTAWCGIRREIKIQGYRQKSKRVLLNLALECAFVPFMHRRPKFYNADPTESKLRQNSLKLLTIGNAFRGFGAIERGVT
jgi:hypothetical protein